MTGHQFGKWRYSFRLRRWSRRCTVGTGSCTAVESVPRGHKPKEVKR